MESRGALIARATAIAQDRDGGASEILAKLLPLLAEAIAAGRDVTVEVARTACRGQPAMAPVWNACAVALADHQSPGRFARARAEMARAPRALVRAASTALREALQDVQYPRLLTVSYSAGVAETLVALVPQTPFDVVCAEGRPRYEGRRMALRVTASGAHARLTTDAAITTYLTGATAVIVGADALAATHWINKVGTLGLVASAALHGVPVYVVASRDKALAALLVSRWAGVEGPPSEVWAEAAPTVDVGNPYFERIPAELATLFLTEAGPVPADHLAQVSERFTQDIPFLLNSLG